MLEFLNPLYLFGLSAAIIPLLIHFFNKRKAKIEKISSIQFLKRIENKNIRNLKLKEYLLLLLRILIILLIVLSFSEPVVKTSGNYSVLSQNNCYFILIDNSYSMKYIMENGLQAKQRVKNEIEILVNKFRNKGSMFLLFSKNDEIKIYPVMKDEKWKERLHEIKWNNSNFLINGLDKALNSIIEEKKTINNYLFVFSDFQKLNNYDWLNSLPTSMSTYFIPFTVTSRKNVGIQGLKIKSKILSPNHKMILELYLKNYSEKIDMETRFFLKINEKVVLQKNVLIPHGDEQFVPVEFLMQMENRGWNTGEIILNSDEIEEDNRYFFSFYVPHDYNILISSGNNNAFWKRVFKPLVAQSGVNVKFINEKELMSVSFNKYDMLLLNTGFNFSGNEVMKIKQFMEEGNRLLLIPEFPVSQTGLEGFFAKFNLGKIDKLTTGKDSLFLLTVSNFKIDGFTNLPAALLKQKVDFLNYFVLNEKNKNINRILKYDNGWPFLISADNLYALTADISPRSSDFNFKALFLPFIYDLTLYLANPELINSYKYRTDDNKIWEMIKDKSVYNNLEIVDPQNKKYRINAGSFKTVNVNKKQVGLFLQPGFYTFITNENEKFYAGVNLNFEESEWSCFKNNDLKKMNIDDVISLEKIDEIEKKLNPYWELWVYLLILAIVLMITEMVISGNWIMPQRHREQGEK